MDNPYATVSDSLFFGILTGRRLNRLSATHTDATGYLSSAVFESMCARRQDVTHNKNYKWMFDFKVDRSGSHLWRNELTDCVTITLAGGVFCFNFHSSVLRGSPDIVSRYFAEDPISRSELRVVKIDSASARNLYCFSFLSQQKAAALAQILDMLRAAPAKIQFHIGT